MNILSRAHIALVTFEGGSVIVMISSGLRLGFSGELNDKKTLMGLILDGVNPWVAIPDRLESTILGLLDHPHQDSRSDTRG